MRLIFHEVKIDTLQWSRDVFLPIPFDKNSFFEGRLLKGCYPNPLPLSEKRL